MAAFVLNDADIWFHSLDLSCVSNQVSAQSNFEEKDSTTFCSGGWRTKVNGLGEASINVSGFWEAQADTDESLDHISFDNLGGTSRLFSVSPTGVEGDRAFFAPVTEFGYQIEGTVGELAAFSFEGMSAHSGLIGGYVAAGRATRDGSDNASTVIDLGAASSSTARIYAGIHVFEAQPGATPAQDVVIESSSASNMSSATERFEFDADSEGSDFSSITGVSARYWRVSWSLSGPANFAVVFGIVN